MFLALKICFYSWMSTSRKLAWCLVTRRWNRHISTGQSHWMTCKLFISNLGFFIRPLQCQLEISTHISIRIFLLLSFNCTMKACYDLTAASYAQASWLSHLMELSLNLCIGSKVPSFLSSIPGEIVAKLILNSFWTNLRMADLNQQSIFHSWELLLGLWCTSLVFWIWLQQDYNFDKRTKDCHQTCRGILNLVDFLLKLPPW